MTREQAIKFLSQIKENYEGIYFDESEATEAFEMATNALISEVAEWEPCVFNGGTDPEIPIRWSCTNCTDEYDEQYQFCPTCGARMW